MQIEVNTPYTFCRNCPFMQIVTTVNVDSESGMEVTHECGNEEICRWIVEDRGE